MRSIIIIILACLTSVCYAQSRYDVLPAHDGGIIFVGDSITDDCEWNELFENDDIINRGIDGDTLEEFIARLPEITRHDASGIFIEIGSSDLNGKSPVRTAHSTEPSAAATQN